MKERFKSHHAPWIWIHLWWLRETSLWFIHKRPWIRAEAHEDGDGLLGLYFAMTCSCVSSTQLDLQSDKGLEKAQHSDISLKCSLVTSMLQVARYKLVSLSPPSRTSTAPFSPAKPSALQEIPPTRHTASSVCCIREETAESPGEDQQTEEQLHPSGCQEAELPPVLAPPPLFYPTQHWTLTLPPPQCPHPQVPPPLLPWPAPVTLCSTGMISTSSSFVCNLPLLTVW